MRNSGSVVKYIIIWRTFFFSTMFVESIYWKNKCKIPMPIRPLVVRRRFSKPWPKIYPCLARFSPGVDPQNESFQFATPRRKWTSVPETVEDKSHSENGGQRRCFHIRESGRRSGSWTLMPYHTVQGKMRNGKIILLFTWNDANVCVVGRRSTSGYSRTRRTTVLWYFWYEHSGHHPYKSVSHFSVSVADV